MSKICNNHLVQVKSYLKGNSLMLASAIVDEFIPWVEKGHCYICDKGEKESKNEIIKIVDSINNTNKVMRNIIGQKLIEGTLERLGIGPDTKVEINIRDRVDKK